MAQKHRLSHPAATIQQNELGNPGAVPLQHGRQKSQFLMTVNQPFDPARTGISTPSRMEDEDKTHPAYNNGYVS